MLYSTTPVCFSFLKLGLVNEWHQLLALDASAGVLGSQDSGAGGPSCLGSEADGTRDAGDHDRLCPADQQIQLHYASLQEELSLKNQLKHIEVRDSDSTDSADHTSRDTSSEPHQIGRESFGLEKLHRTWQSRTNDSVRHVILSLGKHHQGSWQIGWIELN